MPVVCNDIPILSLLPSLEGQIEREISRDLLVEVSPDREDFLRTKDISEIREALRMRLKSSESHWLYRVKRRRDLKMKDISSLRLSFFNAIAFDPTGHRSHEGREGAGPLIIPDQASSSRANVIVAADGYGTFTTWGDRNLSTTDQLVSPRLPGPTHILVVHPVSSTMRISGRQAIHEIRSHCDHVDSPTFSEAMEIPINDLLFVLNVPNLSLPDEAPFSVLPRRQHKELPKVLLPVPHLETFPELVVYLHTKNQAALFRSIIPEWMRDLMHPLPPISSAVGAAGLNFPNIFARLFQSTSLRMNGLKRAFDTLVACSIAPCFSWTNFSETLGVSPTVQRRSPRSLDFIAADIVRAASDFEGRDDPLISTAVSLNALRDNLDYIGFYDTQLWSELLVSQRILLSAISLRARVDVSMAEME